MATRFNDDEAKEILRRAIERDAARGSATGPEELVEIAAELGVSPDDVSMAIAEVTAEREVQQEIAAIKEQRRRSLGGSAITWLFVCALLLVIDILTGPAWWIHWPFAIWGLFIVLQTRRAFFANHERLRGKARAQLEKRRKREERERRRQRHRSLEQGIEQALEKGAAALIDVATRHVDRVTSASPQPQRAARQRVPGASDDHAQGEADSASARSETGPRRYHR